MNHLGFRHRLRRIHALLAEIETAARYNDAKRVQSYTGLIDDHVKAMQDGLDQIEKQTRTLFT